MQLTLFTSRLIISFILLTSSLHAAGSLDLENPVKGSTALHSRGAIVKEAGSGLGLVTLGAGCAVYGAQELFSISNNLTAKSTLHGKVTSLETNNLPYSGGVWVHQEDFMNLRTHEKDLMMLASGTSAQLSSYLSGTGLYFIASGGFLIGWGTQKIVHAGWMCWQNLWNKVSGYSLRSPLVRKDKLD